MVTKEGGFLSFLTGEGTYREEVFQRDLAVIQAAYYDRGFINVRVDKPHRLALAGQALHLHHHQDRPRASRTTSASSTSRAICIVAQGGAAGAMIDVHGGRALQPLQALARTSRRSRTSTTTRATPTRTSTPSPRSNADKQDGGPDLRHPEGPAGHHRAHRHHRATRKTRDQVIRRELRVYEGELFSGTGCAAARSASPRWASSRRWRSPRSRAARTTHDRRPGGGEGEGHRHLPGGPRLLQRGELHLHGADRPRTTSWAGARACPPRRRSPACAR